MWLVLHTRKSTMLSLMPKTKISNYCLNVWNYSRLWLWGPVKVYGKLEDILSWSWGWNLKSVKMADGIDILSLHRYCRHPPCLSSLIISCILSMLVSADSGLYLNKTVSILDIYLSMILLTILMQRAHYKDTVRK